MCKDSKLVSAGFYAFSKHLFALTNFVEIRAETRSRVLGLNLHEFRTVAVFEVVNQDFRGAIKEQQTKASKCLKSQLHFCEFSPQYSALLWF